MELGIAKMKRARDIIHQVKENKENKSEGELVKELDKVYEILKESMVEGK
ncbi:hypothetical protein [Tumebacillus algifaecis]|nr:hypothetical protein [Tumebacillus algifaecis]